MRGFVLVSFFFLFNHSAYPYVLSPQQQQTTGARALSFAPWRQRELVFKRCVVFLSGSVDSCGVLTVLRKGFFAERIAFLESLMCFARSLFRHCGTVSDVYRIYSNVGWPLF